MFQTLPYDKDDAVPIPCTRVMYTVLTHFRGEGERRGTNVDTGSREEWSEINRQFGARSPNPLQAVLPI